MLRHKVCNNYEINCCREKENSTMLYIHMLTKAYFEDKTPIVPREATDLSSTFMLPKPTKPSKDTTEHTFNPPSK